MLKSDLTFVIHFALAVISFYGFVLFLWWWIKTRGFKLGPVYSYITFLLLSVFYSHAIVAHVRSHLLIGDVAARDVDLGTWWWATKDVPLLLFVLLIVGHMSWRAFIVKEK